MHLKTQFLIFFFLCCFIGCSSFGFAAVPNDEVFALLSIKAGLIDPLNSLKDWKLPENVAKYEATHCNWTGVWCNSERHVERLDLSHMNLSGPVSDDIQWLKGLTSLNLCCSAFSSSLPKSMANLTALKSLDVSQNSLVGDFPWGLGKAGGLTTLNASSNNFSGFLPEDLGNATLLETLDLRGSFFQGSIPKSFKNLQKLKFLGLSGNNLTGQIPSELGQLSSLESIILGYNEFEGGIPMEFGNLTNLKYLDLAVGNLSGEIPADLGRLKLLETVFLYKNNFEGKIPPEMVTITSLKLLDLSDNMLSGELPAEIDELKNLQLLNVMCNKLSGSVPLGLASLTQLSVLELWNNSFSGHLPSDLGKNSPLQWLDISSNSFSGEIPSTLCNKGNLTKLILFNNAFTGPIPVSLSTCLSLVRVRMQNNLLSGTIPIGLGKLGKLQRLELANNNLTGVIPGDISSSTSLSFIDISRNHLHSSLPSTILSAPSLQTLMASNNDLVGEIPDQFQDCPSLSVLDLSSNHFSGTIPASIASCEKLVSLNLRNNQLTGDIPKSISMMPTLSILDLSNNSLTGGIPENFGISPALETLNVSYNKLEGPVPANGVLRTINPSDLVGNAGLCGGVLPPCMRNPVFTSRHRSLHTRNIVAGWVIGILSVLAAGIALFGARSLYKRWYSNGSCFEDSFEVGKGEWPWRLMAFQRLGFTTADILACVKESNVIGMGATGIVYKAEISRSNTVVAVKKLWRPATDVETGSSDDLVGEVNVLGRLRHRNIVRLLGFLNNDTNLMIIYEFMHNGSLGETLHGKQAGRLLVDWVSRYNIAVGVAQGLAYLHHDCHPPVIHRDIKSNNILLDANLDARIADFGLARMMVRKNETVSMVAGSYGYIAPEYGYTLKVDEKIDIYSYGVVLLELLTGKRPLDPEFGESVDVVEWIRRKIRVNKSLEEALDPSVGNCLHVQEEMLLVLRIALLCTAKLPKDRPSMRDVITMLGEAKPRRKSISNNNEAYATKKDQPVFSTSPSSTCTASAAANGRGFSSWVSSRRSSFAQATEIPTSISLKFANTQCGYALFLRRFSVGTSSSSSSDQMSLIKQLRERTSAPIKDVKAALIDSNWDIEAAQKELRRRGKVLASKKSSRMAAEGLLALAQNESKAAVIELNCETDFVARNDIFQHLALALAKQALLVESSSQLVSGVFHVPSEDLEDLKLNLEHPKVSGETTVQNAITEVAAVMGENVKLRRGIVMSTTSHGVVSTYLHTSPQPGLGRIAGILSLSVEDKNSQLDAIQRVGSQLAMHVVAAKPLFLTKELVSSDALESEREILKSQAESTGKSQMAIDKIVEGRLRKYYEEVVLMEQKFIMDDTLTVKKLLENLSTEVGSPVKIESFFRMEMGEGIQRLEASSASENLAQAI